MLIKYVYSNSTLYVVVVVVVVVADSPRYQLHRFASVA